MALSILLSLAVPCGLFVVKLFSSSLLGTDVLFITLRGAASLWSPFLLTARVSSHVTPDEWRAFEFFLRRYKLFPSPCYRVRATAALPF